MASAFREFIQHQQPFLDQPLVDGEAAVQALCAVIRNNEHHGILVQYFENPADLLV